MHPNFTSPIVILTIIAVVAVGLAWWLLRRRNRRFGLPNQPRLTLSPRHLPAPPAGNPVVVLGTTTLGRPVRSRRAGRRLGRRSAWTRFWSGVGSFLRGIRFPGINLRLRRLPQVRLNGALLLLVLVAVGATSTYFMKGSAPFRSLYNYTFGVPSDRNPGYVAAPADTATTADSAVATTAVAEDTSSVEVAALPDTTANDSVQASPQAHLKPRLVLTDPVRDAKRARILALAIRIQESQGNLGQEGLSGEKGDWQFMPATWDSILVPAYERATGFHVGKRFDVETQYRVVQWRLTSWLSKGWSPYEICLMWNGGEPPRVKSGVNKYGVPYDTGAYAQGVYDIIHERRDNLQGGFGLSFLEFDFYGDGSSPENTEVAAEATKTPGKWERAPKTAGLALLKLFLALVGIGVLENQLFRRWCPRSRVSLAAASLLICGVATIVFWYGLLDLLVLAIGHNGWSTWISIAAAGLFLNYWGGLMYRQHLPTPASRPVATAGAQRRP